ncbi:hypothetical protein [Paraburkholderia ginsengisoli]|uniref:Uncharacterized protein n=1 Tax=Paraburkholderia ginsengisoli TaxID=311231 RepID=A0A7T4T9T6_9BURK|nr:hypothetical protein [Paraburkholderia ginsengisoli]QQC65340.1 hypothetical protein I6I06_07755 [Paraburkholderia ginsengisoli]
MPKHGDHGFTSAENSAYTALNMLARRKPGRHGVRGSMQREQTWGLCSGA